MYNKGKAPIIILIALIALSLILAVAVFYALQKEKGKNLALQTELADVKTAQKISESKLEESKKTISNLELKLKDSQARGDDLASELEQEKTARQEASTQAEQLRVELSQQKKTRTDLENKLTEAQAEVKKNLEKIAQLDSKKLNLEAQIKEFQAQLEESKTKDVELGTIIVAPEANAPLAAKAPAAATQAVKAAPVAKAPVNYNQAESASFEGKVLVVNKDYNFVVINMGSKDGVRTGDVFSIYHANKYIGDVKVDKVHDSMAAAGFLTADLKDKVSEGDKVSAKSR